MPGGVFHKGGLAEGKNFGILLSVNWACCRLDKSGFRAPEINRCHASPKHLFGGLMRIHALISFSI